MMRVKLLMTAALVCLTVPFAAFGAEQNSKSGAVQTALLKSSQENIGEKISDLQSRWARIKYQIVEKDFQIKELHKLEAKAASLSTSHSNRAEPKIWEAIILATDAGIDSSFSALDKVKKAKKLLEDAMQINASALDGSAHTSLGSLYYQVPGWPISFGNDREAEKHLKIALSINPDGIDPNYFYGDFLYQEERFDDARKHLEKALSAPIRSGRKLADEGRRQEIRASLAKLRETVKNSNPQENMTQ